MAVDDAYTKSLLHFEGADASTTFTDESGKTWTAAGNAQIDTAQKPFGASAGLFDGTGDFITTPDHDDFYFPGDFTIDFRVRFAALPATGGGTTAMTIISQSSATSVGQTIILWVFSGDNTHRRIQFTHIDGVIGSTKMSFWEPAVDTWYHVALVRQGTTLKFYVDGVALDAGTVDADLPGNIAGQVVVGYGDHVVIGGRGYLNGWLKELRTSQVARWTGPFEPPLVMYTPTIVPKMNQYRQRRA